VALGQAFVFKQWRLQKMFDSFAECFEKAEHVDIRIRRLQDLSPDRQDRRYGRLARHQIARLLAAIGAVDLA